MDISRYIKTAAAVTAVCCLLTACDRFSSGSSEDDTSYETVSMYTPPEPSEDSSESEEQNADSSEEESSTSEEESSTSEDESSNSEEDSSTPEQTDPPEDSSEPEATSEESSVEYTPPTADEINSYRAIGDNGILVAGMDGHYRGIMFYGGTYGYCDEYVRNVKEFQAALPEVSVVSMAIPTSLDFYNPPEYSGYTAVQKDKIDYVETELAAAGIKNCSIYSTMEKHTKEPIYARTDHHWMPLGAYYAAQKYCKDLGLKISPLSSYRAATYGGYVGSMYNYSHDPHLYEDAEDYTVYYSPNEDKLKTTYYNNYFTDGYESNLFIVDNASYYYLSFLGSDDRIAHVHTDVKNGRKLVVIKESYGNGLIPFLTEAFEDIYVLDLRYAEVNAVKFCKKVGATDMLIATCAYTVAGVNCDYLNYIRTL